MEHIPAKPQCINVLLLQVSWSICLRYPRRHKICLPPVGGTHACFSSELGVIEGIEDPVQSLKFPSFGALVCTHMRPHMPVGINEDYTILPHRDGGQRLAVVAHSLQPQIVVEDVVQPSQKEP